VTDETRACRRQAWQPTPKRRRHRKALSGSAGSPEKAPQNVSDSQARTRTRQRHAPLGSSGFVIVRRFAHRHGGRSTFEIKTAGGHLKGRWPSVKATGTVRNFNFSSLEFFQAFDVPGLPAIQAVFLGLQVSYFSLFNHFEWPAVQSTFAAKRQRASSRKAILAVNLRNQNGANFRCA
jgi:hypothetical protein